LLEGAALFAIKNFVKYFQNDKFGIFCGLAGRIELFESAILNLFALMRNKK
jgi:hypothetical protein